MYISMELDSRVFNPSQGGRYGSGALSVKAGGGDKVQGFPVHVGGIGYPKSSTIQFYLLDSLGILLLYFCPLFKRIE